MSLHRVDPRFVLPHGVRTAVVMDGLEEWRTGLRSAGIEVSATRGSTPPDVAVAGVRDIEAARSTGARSIIVEGSRGVGSYVTRRFLLRPSRARPTLALPLDQPAPATYALDRWSVLDRRWKRARARAARALVGKGFFPSWASPTVTVSSRIAGQPPLVSAASELGVPPDAAWFLTFGQGDALSRNAFQLFRPEGDEPEWVLKFARVAGYSRRFDDDERGLGLARAAGATISAHVPRLLGRFEIDGIHASLENAAVGSRLRDVLLTPGEGARKLNMVETIAGWIVELGRRTSGAHGTLDAERQRLRDDVVPRWRELGVGLDLVDSLPTMPSVTQHNDLGSWNVVVDDDAFVVVDWENARPAVLPLWDLLYFLGDTLVLVDHGLQAPASVPHRMANLFAGGAPSSRILFAWVRRAVEAASVPEAEIGRIATLCWLSHSLSASVHNVDIAAFAPGDPPRLHGLEGMARAWMEHPALGPNWSSWRG